MPWFRIFFTTNLPCGPSSGFSSCCISAGRGEARPAPRARYAHEAQAQAFDRAQTVRGPDAQAFLCVLRTGYRGDPSSASCPARSDALHEPPPSYRGYV